MSNDWKFTILDVGHGSAAVLEAAGHVIVIDTGPGTSLLEFLTETGITTIDVVFLSHADSDHIKGLIALLGQETFKIQRVIVNSDSEKESKVWLSLAWEMDAQHFDSHLSFEVGLSHGMTFPFAGGATIEVLAPRPALALIGPGTEDELGRRVKTNTISAVLKLKLGDATSVLVTGDLDELGLWHLMQSGVDCQCSVLVFPHHGGNVDSSANAERNQAFAKTLMEAVQPSTIVFSTGRNRWANPRPEIVSMVTSQSWSPRVMCTQLSSNCAPGVGTVQPNHLTQVFAEGRKRSMCCAGSVTIAEDSIGPNEAEHLRFIKEAAPTAMCQQNAK